MTTEQLLTERITSILGFIEESVKQGSSFAAEQMPDVVNQILIWGFWRSFLIWVFWLVLLPICACIFIWSSKKVDKGNYDVSPPHMFICIFTGFLSVVSIIVVLSNWDWLKITLAPKLYLLQYISDFIR